MIKAIFFDWFNTLAHFKPSRAVIHSQALEEYGIELAPEKLIRGLLLADNYWFEAKAKGKFKQNPHDQLSFRIHYEEIVLSEAGTSVPQATLMKVMERIQELYKGVSFILFDDVLITLKALKERDYTLGIITNLEQDMNALSRQMDLSSFISLIITPKEAGVNKPSPLIFTTALQYAGVKPVEAIHIGDQYKIDTLGAHRAGLKAILMDRFNIYPKITDFPRITSMAQLITHLN